MKKTKQMSIRKKLNTENAQALLHHALYYRLPVIYDQFPWEFPFIILFVIMISFPHLGGAVWIP